MDDYNPYIIDDKEISLFEKNIEFWGVPHHNEEVLFAVFQREGDGRTVEVYRTALPAVVYRIKVLEDTIAYYSCAESRIRPGYELSTASSQSKLVSTIARAISQGLLDLTSPEF